MKVSATLDNLFVPEFNENRDLPPSEQIKVELKRPTMEQKNSLRQIDMNREGDKFGFRYEAGRILRQHVGKIQNLESEVNGEAVQITSGKMLAENTNPGLDPLVTEICMEVTRGLELSEEEEKN